MKPDNKPIGRPVTRDEETKKAQVLKAVKNRQERMRAEGYRILQTYLPPGYKARIDAYCQNARMTKCDFLCALCDFIDENPSLFPDFLPEDQGQDHERTQHEDKQRERPGKPGT